MISNHKRDRKIKYISKKIDKKKEEEELAITRFQKEKKLQKKHEQNACVLQRISNLFIHDEFISLSLELSSSRQ